MLCFKFRWTLTLNDISNRLIDDSSRFNSPENWKIAATPNIKRIYFTSKKHRQECNWVNKNTQSHSEIAWWLKLELKLKNNPFKVEGYLTVIIFSTFRSMLKSNESGHTSDHHAIVHSSWYYGTVVLYSCTVVLYPYLFHVWYYVLYTIY